MKKINLIYPAIWVLAVVGVCSAGFYFIKSNDAKISAVAGTKVVATVNGYAITEAELAPMVQQGMDKASAIDRRITQSIVAKAAEDQYKTEAEILLSANRNDILSQLYLAKKVESLKKAVTEKDISDFYSKNVRDEDYKQASLKVFLSSDARDAQTFYENLVRTSGTRDQEAQIAKMNYLQKEGDHSLPLQSVPYNLGQIIKNMKSGDVLQPVVIREGVLVVYVESIKESPKPALDKVKEEIKNLLVNERLGNEIQDLRKKSKIELKG